MNTEGEDHGQRRPGERTSDNRGAIADSGSGGLLYLVGSTTGGIDDGLRRIPTGSPSGDRHYGTVPGSPWYGPLNSTALVTTLTVVVQ